MRPCKGQKQSKVRYSCDSYYWFLIKQQQKGVTILGSGDTNMCHQHAQAF